MHGHAAYYSKQCVLQKVLPAYFFKVRRTTRRRMSPLEKAPLHHCIDSSTMLHDHSSASCIAVHIIHRSGIPSLNHCSATQFILYADTSLFPLLLLCDTHIATKLSSFHINSGYLLLGLIWSTLLATPPQMLHL
jgi:hypothetical protein